jgi:phosphate transport system substrate-binding protein
VLIVGLLVGVIAFLVPRIDLSDHNGSADDGDAGGGSTPAAKASGGDVECAPGTQEVLGSGSSAQNNAMDTWIKNYTAACPDTRISYNAVGSGAGVSEFMKGTTDFAGSDTALTRDQSAKSCKGGAINLPVLGNPIALVYNLPGVNNLVLDAPTLAKIYDLRILRWDDPSIQALNPGVKLPAMPILTLHRSDQSGTNQTLSSYLTSAAADYWPYPPDTQWSAPAGQGASGSAGVAKWVKQLSGSIGYVEPSYVTSSNLPTADLDTGTGRPVDATADHASEGIAAATVVGTGKDLALELNYAPKPKAVAAYPIVSVTYEIVCAKGGKRTALKYFLDYISSAEGQISVKQLGYAPLPAALAAKVRATVATIA